MSTNPAYNYNCPKLTQEVRIVLVKLDSESFYQGNCSIKSEPGTATGIRTSGDNSGSESKLHENVNINQNQWCHEVSKYVKIEPDGDDAEADCEEGNNDFSVSRSSTGNKEQSRSGKKVTSIQCFICKKYFSHKRNLTRHHKQKHGNIPLPATTEVRLPRMTTYLNDSQNPLMCTYCQKVFTCTGTLNIHIRLHRPPGMELYSCKFCEKEFVRRRSWRLHQRTHSDDRPYSCSKCDFTTKRYSGIAQHKAICFEFKVQDEIAKKNRQRFHCDLCGKPFKTESGAYNHKVVTEGNCKVFACSTCGKKFFKESLFKEHESVAHNNEYPFSCSLCDRKFKLKTALQSHTRHVHTQNWSCTRVGCSVKGLPTKSAWKRHLKKCDKGIVCSTCEQIFDSKETYASHTHPIQCEKCKKTYPKKSQMDLHLVYHDPLNLYKCDGCTFGFASCGELTTHKKMNHKSNNLILNNFIVRSSEDIYYFTCKYCEAEFEDPSSTQLVDHARSTHSDKIGQFICPDCGKGFNTEFKSFTHRNICHGPVQTDFKCEICVLYFLTIHGLDIHNRKSHYDVPLVKVAETLQTSENSEHLETSITLGEFSCLICGKKCQNRSSLRRHMTMHSMDKEYKCELCVMSWTDSKALNRHNRIRHPNLHLEPIPVKHFICSYCDKTFNHVCKLNLHIRIHTKEKPFKCEICDKRFRLPDSQTKHMLTHTREKPKSCDFCGAAFASNAERDSHIRRYHKIDA